jgi:hypothetical protein
VVVDTRTGAEVLRFGEDARTRLGTPGSAPTGAGSHPGTATVASASGTRPPASSASSSPATPRRPTRSAGAPTRRGSPPPGRRRHGARLRDLRGRSARELVVVSARDTANGLAAVVFSPDGERIMTGDWAIVVDEGLGRLGEGRRRVGRPSRAPPSPGSRRRRIPARRSDAPGARSRRPSGSVGRRGRRAHRRPRSAGTEYRALGGVFVAGTVARRRADRGSITEDGLSLHDLETGRRVAVLPTVEGWVTDGAWTRDSDAPRLRPVPGRGRPRHGHGGRPDRRGGRRDHRGGRVGHPAGGLHRRRLPARGDAACRSRRSPAIVGLRVWDWRAGTPVLDIEALALDVAAAPTGDRIAFVRELTGEAEIWDVGSGSGGCGRSAAAGAAYGISWSHDGERIALAGADGTVRVFDAGDGRLELILRGHGRAVSSRGLQPGRPAPGLARRRRDGAGVGPRPRRAHRHRPVPRDALPRRRTSVFQYLRRRALRGAERTQVRALPQDCHGTVPGVATVPAGPWGPPTPALPRAATAKEPHMSLSAPATHVPDCPRQLPDVAAPPPRVGVRRPRRPRHRGAGGRSS